MGVDSVLLHLPGERIPVDAERGCGTGDLSLHRPQDPPDVV
jgi:hypothetical protein